MTKGKPTSIAASVRQRSLNIAREQKEDFQLILIRYVLERFLFRLSTSTFREVFILKGAMLFQIWSNETHRPTRDVDFLSSGEPSEKRIENIFLQILNQPVPDDGLRFETDSILVEAIKEDQNYQGIRVRLNAYLDSARIPVQVDVGFGDAVDGEGGYSWGGANGTQFWLDRKTSCSPCSWFRHRTTKPRRMAFSGHWSTKRRVLPAVDSAKVGRTELFKIETRTVTAN